jgi:predicted amidohydrolase YtcJ
MCSTLVSTAACMAAASRPAVRVPWPSATNALMDATVRDPNPLGGEIVKDPSGEPNGILKNAQSLVNGLDRTGQFTEAEKLDALEQQLKRTKPPA